MTDFSGLDAAFDSLFDGAEAPAPLARQVFGRLAERLANPAASARKTHAEAPAGAPAAHGIDLFPAPPFFDLASLEALLRHCADARASGIHFAPGAPVKVSLHGHLRDVTARPLSHAECAAVSHLLHNEEASARVMSRHPIRSAYGFRHRGQPYRFRLMMAAVEQGFTDGVSIAARVLPPAPPPYQALGLPRLLHTLLLKPYEGLVLVAGPTGSGKTTLLASTLLEIAQRHPFNILMFEEPIEIVHPTSLPNGALIRQTEVYRHVTSWEDAVEIGLRSEPNAILIGELLDAPTFKALMRVCNTGHLVYSTVHATGFAATLDKLASLFPVDDKKQTLRSVLSVLRLVVSQRLIPCTDGTRTAVWEFIELTPAVVDRLLDTTNPQLTAKFLLPEYGWPYQRSLEAKYEAGLISETVYRWGLENLCGVKL